MWEVHCSPSCVGESVLVSSSSLEEPPPTWLGARIERSILSFRLSREEGRYRPCIRGEAGVVNSYPVYLNFTSIAQGYTIREAIYTLIQ